MFSDSYLFIYLFNALQIHRITRLWGTRLTGLKYSDLKDQWQSMPNAFKKIQQLNYITKKLQ